MKVFKACDVPSTLLWATDIHTGKKVVTRDGSSEDFDFFRVMEFAGREYKPTLSSAGVVENGCTVDAVE